MKGDLACLSKMLPVEMIEYYQQLEFRHEEETLFRGTDRSDIAGS